MDRLTKEQRHKNMIANKSRGTQIELLLARVLWNAGVRYRKNDKGVHGTPDFSIRGYRIAIFCDGEFWHGKDWEVNKERIKSNRDFWYAKIERNIRRDREITLQLETEGWKVFRFWETDIRKHADQCANQVLAFIQQRRAEKSKLRLTQVADGQRIPVQIAPGKKLSIVSHFLYNKDQPSAAPFVQPAKHIIGQLYDLNEQDSDIESLVAEPEIQYSLGSNRHTAPFLPQQETTFTFVDLFAGIGGIRLALQELGGRCVFCSEWNPEAQYTYMLNFGEVPFGDITDEAIRQLIPDQFDVLCASIPPQRFALASKKSSLEKMRGTLFHPYLSILQDKRPDAFLLETESTIFTIDKGKTIQLLLATLRNTLGYEVPEPRTLAASDFGLPHDSKRVYITGSLPVTTTYHLSEQAGTTHKKWHYEAAPNKEDIRKLTPREMARLQGFPDSFILKVNNTVALRLLKKASIIPCVKEAARLLNIFHQE